MTTVLSELAGLSLVSLSEHDKSCTHPQLPSAYTSGYGVNLTNYGMIVTNKLELKGYSVVDYVSRMGEGVMALVEAAKTGKLHVEGAETIVDLRGKFEDVPKVWDGLFEGKNTGKLITKVAD